LEEIADIRVTVKCPKASRECGRGVVSQLCYLGTSASNDGAGYRFQCFAATTGCSN